MPKRIRKRFTSQEKVAILRLHLLEGTPVSDLCDKHGIGPSMFYRWQKDFFENGAAAMEPRARRATDHKDRKIALLAHVWGNTTARAAQTPIFIEPATAVAEIA